MHIKYLVITENLLYALKEHDIILPTPLLYSSFYFTSILYNRAEEPDTLVIGANDIPSSQPVTNAIKMSRHSLSESVICQCPKVDRQYILLTLQDPLNSIKNIEILELPCCKVLA